MSNAIDNVQLINYVSKIVTSDVNASIAGKARQQAEWAWTDVMIAFREIGYDPTQNEKERILHQLSVKKATSLYNREIRN